MRPEFCIDASPVFFNLFDFSIAPPLLYYAYIPTIIITLILAGLALYHNSLNRNSRYFAALAGVLVTHVFFVFVTWIAAPVDLVMFGWQMWPITLSLLFLSTYLFLYSYIFDKQASNTRYYSLMLPLIPIALLLPTELNVTHFDIANCEGVSHGFLTSYTYAYSVYVLINIFLIGITGSLKPELTKLKKRQVWIMVGSSIMALSAFIVTAFIGDLTGYYEFETVGPISMLMFIAAMSYVSTDYQKFNLKILGVELMMIGLITLVGSIIFVRSLTYVQYIATGTLFAVAVLGWMLSRSVRKEIESREKISHLAMNLEKANTRLQALDKQKSEFVSIASHQLRSPITSIRGYASMLLEGSYGDISKKASIPIQRIEESSRLMALAIEDYLNVSRIESGNMKYNLSDFNLKNEAEKICDDLRNDAIKNGLVLLFRSDLHSKGIINADIGKTVQIIQNLVHNAIKYTKSGTIKVLVRDNVNRKRIYIDIIDTGIGMDTEALQTIFQKFERASNANSINVNGTGLGLYVALRMAEAMGGTITAHSDGNGAGSRFTIELPLAI